MQRWHNDMRKMKRNTTKAVVWMLSVKIRKSIVYTLDPMDFQKKEEEMWNVNKQTDDRKWWWWRMVGERQKNASMRKITAERITAATFKQWVVKRRSTNLHSSFLLLLFILLFCPKCQKFHFHQFTKDSRCLPKWFFEYTHTINTTGGMRRKKRFIWCPQTENKKRKLSDTAAAI